MEQKISYSWFDDNDLIFSDDDKKTIQLFDALGATREKELHIEYMRGQLLMQYREISKNPEYPSLKDFLEENPYKCKQKILDYLRTYGILEIPWDPNEERVDCVTADIVKFDDLSGMFSDGFFSWTSELIYYVDKHNLRLPRSFERYILKEHFKEIPQENRIFLKKIYQKFARRKPLALAMGMSRALS